MDSGIGVDGSRWCHLDGSNLASACGAPGVEDEYSDLRTVRAVVDYFADPWNAAGSAGDAVGGVAGAVTKSVYVARGRGKNGKYAVRIAQYSDDFGFLQGSIPKGAEKITVGARMVGRVMLVVDASLTGLDEWEATQGHPTYYRIGYTAFETAAKVGGAAAGATAGTKGGVVVGCAIAPGVGCVVGGIAGAIAGGFLGAFFADHLTDYIWEVAPAS